VLISSSTPSSATWQTAPTHNSFESSQSNRSQNSGSNAAQSAENSTEPGNSSGQTASSEGQSNAATNAGTSQQSLRRGRSTKQASENTQASSTGDAKTSAATSNAQQQPFQAILNEVLPAADTELASTGKTKLDQSLTQAQDDTALNSNNASSASTQGQYADALDPAFQITKEAMLSQKLADAQVAFAARVTEQAGTAATLNLRDAQAAIAASRFDTARAAANTGTDTQTASGAKTADPANLAASLPAGSSAKDASLPTTPAAKASSQAPVHAAADSHSSADANANDANANSDSDAQQRDTNGPDTLRASSEPETAATTPQTAQGTQGSVLTPTPVAGNGVGVRESSPAKATTESARPQLLEQQGDSGVRAGESVHNISLRLTNADQSTVQVRLTERAGELQVSVRTPDVSLTRGLRDGLPDLMGRLQVNGYRADTWQPGGNGNSAGQDQGQDAPSHGNSQKGNSDGSGSQGQQQSSQHQQQDEQTPKWVRELESSIQRSDNPWRPAV
jgi:hypothetical protein